MVDPTILNYSQNTILANGISKFQQIFFSFENSTSRSQSEVQDYDFQAMHNVEPS